MMQRRKCQTKDGPQDPCFGVLKDEVTICKLIQVN